MTKKTSIISTFIFLGTIMAFFTPFFTYANTNFSISFNGINQATSIEGIDCSKTPRSPLCVNPGDNYTISAWIKLNSPISTTTNQVIFSTNMLPFFSVSNDKIYYRIRTNNGGFYYASVPFTFNADTWYHVSVVQSFSNFHDGRYDTLVKFYVGTENTDDIQIGNDITYLRAMHMSQGQLSRANIGAYNSGGVLESFFNGSIDNLQIWHTDLTLSAINQYKFSELSNISHLQATYYFNQNLNDSAGNEPPANMTGVNNPTYSTNTPLNPHADFISIDYPTDQSANIQPFNFFRGTYTAWLSNSYDLQLKVSTSSQPFLSSDAFDIQATVLNIGLTASTTDIWQLPSPNLLPNTNYYMQIRMKPTGTTDWTATSTITRFTMAGLLSPYITDTSITNTILNSTTSSTSVPTALTSSCDINSGWLDYAICNSISFLFAPHQSTLNNWSSLKEELKYKPPFGYFTSYQNAVNQLSNGTTTSNFQLADISSLNDSFLNKVNDALKTLIWLAFAFGVVKRLKHLEL